MGPSCHLPVTRYHTIRRSELRSTRHTFPGSSQLTTQAPADQSMQIFSLVISLITVGSVVVTINSKLLGGKV